MKCETKQPDRQWHCSQADTHFFVCIFDTCLQQVKVVVGEPITWR